MTKGIDFTGISVSALVYHPGKWLLCNYRTDQCRDERWKWDNRWGGLKFHETIAHGIRRELQEEFDIDFSDDQITYLWHREQFRTHEDKPTHWIWFYHFVILNDNQKIKNMEPHKHSELKFFSLQNLPPIDDTHSMFYGVLYDFKEQIEHITQEEIILP